MCPNLRRKKPAAPTDNRKLQTGAKTGPARSGFRRWRKKTFSKCVINCYNKCTFIFRAVGAAVARPPHTRKVTGSNPVLPTIYKIPVLRRGFFVYTPFFRLSSNPAFSGRCPKSVHFTEILRLCFKKNPLPQRQRG